MTWSARRTKFGWVEKKLATCLREASCNDDQGQCSILDSLGPVV
jgi:hypothetical protein